MASALRDQADDIASMQEEQIQAHANFLLDIYPRLEAAVARKLIETCEDFEQACQFAENMIDVGNASNSYAEPSSADSCTKYTQALSQSSNDVKEGNEEASGEFSTVVKREIAQSLVQIFPEQSEGQVIRTVSKSSPDISDTAARLFDGTNDDEKDEPEVLIKSEKVETSFLDPTTSGENPPSSEESQDAISFENNKARSPPFSRAAIQNSTPSPSPSFIGRANGRVTESFTIRTGPTERHCSKSSKASRSAQRLENRNRWANLLLSNVKSNKFPEDPILKTPVKRQSDLSAEIVTLGSFPVHSLSTSNPSALRLQSFSERQNSHSDASSRALRVTESSDTTSSHFGNAESISNSMTSIKDEDSQDEEESIQSSSDWPSDDEETKIAKLQSLVPHLKTTADECRTELLLSDGNIDEAKQALEENRDAAPDDGSQELSGLAEMDSSEKQPASKKRGIDSLEADNPPPALKRSRTTENDDRLEMASEWVEDFVGNGTIQIVLDKGIHPLKFTKAALAKLKILEDELAMINENGDSTPSIRISGVEVHIFNLAICWAACNNIRLDRANSTTKNAQLDTLLALVIFGDKMRLNLRLHNESSEIMTAIRNILIAEREVLEGSHVRLVFSSLGRDHPLRTLLAQAAVRPHIEFRYDTTNDPDASDSNSESEAGFRDAAHKAAHQRKRSPFHEELDGPDPVLEFLCQFYPIHNRAWHRREVRIKRKRASKKKGLGNALNIDAEIWVTDPLTDTPFIV